VATPVRSCCEHHVVTLTLTFLDAAQRDHEWVAKPFPDVPGFERYWWIGDCAGPVDFASFFNEDGEEVARAMVKLASIKGTAYPTWERPVGGVVEIDLLEVKSTMRGRGIGAEAVALLLTKYNAPVFAMAKNERAEGFWRTTIGWQEHLQPEDEDAHPEASKPMPLYVWNG
jgi:GNAT superfamily N-acetyltransferase